MDQPAPVIRIVVYHALPAVRAVHSAAESFDAAAGYDTIAALGRLGSEVSIERAYDSASCLAKVDACDADLVVMDGEALSDSCSLLESLSDHGPPVVVIDRDRFEETALDAFRRGAADCVRVGKDYQTVLPAVALEQIRRWRRRRERGAAESRIRWLERLNKAIVSEIPAGLAVLEAEGRVVTLNPECSRMLNVSSEDASGQLLESVFPKDLLESGGISRLIIDVSEGRNASPRRARGLDRKGELRTFDVRSQRLDDEGRTLLVLSDITEGEAQAQRIGDLQRYNENIIQNMNSALVVVNADELISFANPTAENILAVEPGDLIGRRIDEWFVSTASEPNLIEQTLSKAECFKGAEAVISRADGRVIPIGISCSPLVDQAGEGLGAVVIFQDLSEIKQLERQVLQSEKMASIGQLAAGVAHEINNPMGFIHANLFQMAEYLGDLDGVWEKLGLLQDCIKDRASGEEINRASEALRKVSDEVDFEFVKGDFVKAVRESQEGSERIRHIVCDLRDFSHQDTAVPTLADVNQCVDSTVSIVWTMMKHTIVLKKDYQDLPRLRCFPMQLKQVFMNLLVNAYQAIDEVIDVARRTGEIEVRSLQRDDGIVISVRDSGMGISPEYLSRIFDPFFTTKEVGAGTGLGLSTSYNIVERHGGRIDVASEVGVGTTFEVWLPDSGIQEVRA